MKTAMQELIEYLESRYFKYEISSILLKSKELLQKEKEQIKDAAKSCNYIGGATNTEAEQYYNETFKK